MARSRRALPYTVWRDVIQEADRQVGHGAGQRPYHLVTADFVHRDS
jgi:hypothetical protein